MKKVILFLKVFFVFAVSIHAQFSEKVVDEIIRKSLASEGPGGALLIQHNGKTVYNKAFGYADAERNTLTTTETVFQIGSISKQMTAVGILLLVEEEKLSLNDTVTKFIPDFIEPANKVTVENLLLHNSGIPSFTSSPTWNPTWESKRTLTEVIDLIKNEKFDFNPGEKFQYNNSGYAILALIIEKVSGMNYGDFMKEKVFNPLGMYQTRHGSSKEDIGLRAEGFTVDLVEKKLKKAVYTEFDQLSGAGSFISTTDDMAIWINAVNTKKLLSSASWGKALSPYIKTNWGESNYYGYGWVIEKFYGHHLIWHNGGMPGFLSTCYSFPNDDLSIIFLTNSDFISADAVTKRIAKAILNAGLAKYDPMIIPNGELAKFEGTYSYSRIKYTIALEESGKLKLTYPELPFPKLSFIPATLDTLYEETLEDFVMVITEFEDGIPTTGQFIIEGKKLKFYRDGYEPKFEITKTSVDELLKYEGSYEFAPGAEMKVYIKDGELKAVLRGQPEYTLEFIGEHRFQLKGLTGFLMIFEVDENIVVTGVTSSQPNGDFKAKKK